MVALIKPNMFYTEKKEKECPACHKKFKTLDVRAKYCSIQCSKTGRKNSEDKRRVKYERQNILKFGLRKNIKPVMTFKCKNCGKKFPRYQSQVKKRGAGYCSFDCRVAGRTNEKPKDKQLVDLWAEVVKLYDGGKCAYCGKTSYLNSHHIFSKSNHSTRYEIINGITLCAGHHTLSSVFSAHKTPVEFVEWIKEKRGNEWYEQLRAKAKQTKDYTKEELVRIRDNFLEIRQHLAHGIY
jgi:5-methylcytosine-specific restriction endonuclease McrA